MAQTKEQKKNIINDLKEKIGRQKALVFVDFTGLRVKEMSVLKKNLRETGSELKVAKKTLMGVALKEKNIKADAIEMEGEIALIFGFKDEMAPARSTYQFAKTNPNLKIRGGYMNDIFLSAESVIELAQLPSKQELLGKLVGSISAPINNFVYVLQANIKGLVYVLNAIKNNK